MCSGKTDHASAAILYKCIRAVHEVVHIILYGIPVPVRTVLEIQEVYGTSTYTWCRIKHYTSK